MWCRGRILCKNRISLKLSNPTAKAVGMLKGLRNRGDVAVQRLYKKYGRDVLLGRDAINRVSTYLFVAFVRTRFSGLKDGHDYCNPENPKIP